MILRKNTYIFLFAIFAISIANNIPAGYIFLSGDFAQILNFSFVLETLKYNWASYGLGGFSILFSYFPYFIFFAIIQEIVGVNHILIFYSAFFLLSSFLSFRIFSRAFFSAKKEFIINVLSFTYALNIYTFNKFISPTPFSFLYLVIPPIFALTYKYFLKSKLIDVNLSILGIVLFVANIAFGNAAFFISLNIFLFVFLLLVLFLHRKTIKFVLFFKKALIFYGLFFLTSFIAIIPQIPGLLNMVSNFSGGGGYFNLDEWIFWQALDFRGLWFFSDDILGMTKIYSIAALLPGMTLFIFFIIAIRKKHLHEKTKIVAIFASLVFFAIFLINKGKGILSKEAVMEIFGGNPIFSSIRSLDKTLIFLPFFMLIVILLFLGSIENKKTSYVVSVLFLFFTTVPLYPAFQGKLLTNYMGIDIGKDYKSSEYAYIVKIPDEYYALSNRLAMRRLDFRLFSAPYNVLNSIGWINFPKWKAIGSDPTIQLFNQPVVQMNAPQAFGNWNYGKIWNEQNEENSGWLIPFVDLLGIKYIIFHKDVADQFVAQTMGKIEYYEKNNLITKIEDNSYFNVYKINNSQAAFFYTSQNSIISQRTIDDLPKILSSPDWQTRSAVFFAGQNVGRENVLEKLKSSNNQNSSDSGNNNCVDKGGVVSPTLEFKKINPTKYRVRVHGASGVFPLVFSESFHDGWKSYLVNQGVDSRLRGNDNLSKYKTLDGNAEDQATKDELQNDLDNGYVTTLGDGKEKTIEHKKWADPVKSSADDHGASGQEQLDYAEKYNIDFVSKNFQGTIQNDNLPNGHFWETWFRRPIENNANHLTANGYANSWVIDTNQVCAGGNIKCIRNPDGTYDFEMVVEFWPQRLFYIGLAISLSTLLACIGYLVYDWKKRRKQKKLDRKIV